MLATATASGVNGPRRASAVPRASRRTTARVNRPITASVVGMTSSSPTRAESPSWYGRGEVPPDCHPMPTYLLRASGTERPIHMPSEGQPFKTRQSACSFGLRTPLSDHHIPVGPGPLQYKIPEQVTRYGKAATPSYSMGRRLESTPMTDPAVPGPGEYSPETTKIQRGPAFTLMGRKRDIGEKDKHASLPAPNQYSLPPCIGTKVPHKPYSGAVRFNGRPKEDVSHLNRSPGPAQYALPSVSAYMPQAPRASMTGHKKITLVNDCVNTPAPSAYSVESATGRVRRCPPRFSFGVRHSSLAHSMTSPEDK